MFSSKKIAILFGVDEYCFFAPLLTSLSFSRGFGTPTFTRATTATVTDFEGIIKTVKSGEARFEGARRVENLVTNAEAFNSWGKQSITVDSNVEISPLGDMTADRVNFQAVVASGLNSNNSAAGTYTVSVYAKIDTPGKSFRLLTWGAADGYQYSPEITPTGTWTRYSYTVTITGLSGFYIYNQASGIAGSVFFWGYQAELVNGQTNQNPSEYVSTGVLSAPYHGANVDGVKYFATQNGNTVASNVVTEATGANIPDATLHGYVAEGARTNSILQSQTLATTWTATNITVATDSAVSPSQHLTLTGHYCKP
jgi:hypothetical protein